MVAIDANALLVLLLGLMNPKIIKTHKRTSIYCEEDYHNLLLIIGDIEKLIILPNVWTEVDNLLNNFRGSRKKLYIDTFRNTVNKTSEEYLATNKIDKNNIFYDLGLTDTLLLKLSEKCEMLITADSELSDYASAFGAKVYDMVKERNLRLNKDTGFNSVSAMYP